MIRIPLTIYRVEYTYSEDRKFTELDFLVLKSIKNEYANLAQLEDLFSLPTRILMEVIVGLIEHGYVGLASVTKGGIIITPQGKAVDSVETMSGTAELESSSITIVRENITGMLIQSSKKNLYHKNDNYPVQDILAPPPQTLPGSDVKSIIQSYLKSGEFLHHISKVSRIMSERHFNISFDSFGNLELPKGWHNSTLERILFECIQTRAPQKIAPTQAKTAPATNEFSILKGFLPEQDILWDKDSHAVKLTQALEKAQSHLLIISAHVKSSCIAELNGKLTVAVRRGVHIDLVIGISVVDDLGIKQIKELIGKINRLHHPGSITLHEPSPINNSDVKLLLYDTPSKNYVAILGSYNWLFESVTPDDIKSQHCDVSVIIRDPKAISDIVSHISGHCQDLSQRWQSICRDEIDITIVNFEQNKSSTTELDTGPEKITYRLIFDQTNAFKFEDMQYSAEYRLLACSHKIGKATIGGNKKGDLGRIRYLNNKTDNFEAYFYFDDVNDSWGKEEEEILRKRLPSNAVIQQKKGLHARVVVTDESVLLSSFNFLLASTQAHSQIGIMFKNKGIADMVWEKLI